MPAWGTAKVKLTELNPHLICVLCGGYFIDATTINECLHTFCKTCIVRYLETSKYCPVCDVMVHKTKPLLHIRPDHLLQALVYKMVPGLFTSEITKRKTFYDDQGQGGQQPPPDEETLEESMLGSKHRTTDILDPYMSRKGADKEKISVSLQFSPNGRPIDEYEFTCSSSDNEYDEEMTQPRYLLCPAAFSVYHLKKFLRMKFDLNDSYLIDVFHIDEPLCDKYTLMDIAYVYAWRRLGPLRLFYSVYQNPVKKRKLVHEATVSVSDATSEPPAKKESPPTAIKPANGVKVAPVLEEKPTEVENLPKAAIEEEEASAAPSSTVDKNAADGEKQKKSSKSKSHKRNKKDKEKNKERRKKKKKSKKNQLKQSKHKTHKSSRKRKELESICDLPAKCSKLSSEVDELPPKESCSATETSSIVEEGPSTSSEKKHKHDKDRKKEKKLKKGIEKAKERNDRQPILLKLHKESYQLAIKNTDKIADKVFERKDAQALVKSMDLKRDLFKPTIPSDGLDKSSSETSAEIKIQVPAAKQSNIQVPSHVGKTDSDCKLPSKNSGCSLFKNSPTVSLATTSSVSSVCKKSSEKTSPTSIKKNLDVGKRNGTSLGTPTPEKKSPIFARKSLISEKKVVAPEKISPVSAKKSPSPDKKPSYVEKKVLAAEKPQATVEKQKKIGEKQQKSVEKQLKAVEKEHKTVEKDQNTAEKQQNTSGKQHNIAEKQPKSANTWPKAVPSISKETSVVNMKTKDTLKVVLDPMKNIGKTVKVLVPKESTMKPVTKTVNGNHSKSSIPSHPLPPRELLRKPDFFTSKYVIPKKSPEKLLEKPKDSTKVTPSKKPGLSEGQKSPKLSPPAKRPATVSTDFQKAFVKHLGEQSKDLSKRDKVEKAVEKIKPIIKKAKEDDKEKVVEKIKPIIKKAKEDDKEKVVEKIKPIIEKAKEDDKVNGNHISETPKPNGTAVKSNTPALKSPSTSSPAPMNGQSSLITKPITSKTVVRPTGSESKRKCLSDLTFPLARPVNKVSHKSPTLSPVIPEGIGKLSPPPHLKLTLPKYPHLSDKQRAKSPKPLCVSADMQPLDLVSSSKSPRSKSPGQDHGQPVVLNQPKISKHNSPGKSFVVSPSKSPLSLTISRSPTHSATSPFYPKQKEPTTLQRQTSHPEARHHMPQQPRPNEGLTVVRPKVGLKRSIDMSLKEKKNVKVVDLSVDSKLTEVNHNTIEIVNDPGPSTIVPSTLVTVPQDQRRLDNSASSSSSYSVQTQTDLSEAKKSCVPPSRPVEASFTCRASL